jgi:hypothetical protein
MAIEIRIIVVESKMKIEGLIENCEEKKLEFEKLKPESMVGMRRMIEAILKNWKCWAFMFFGMLEVLIKWSRKIIFRL